MDLCSEVPQTGDLTVVMFDKASNTRETKRLDELPEGFRRKPKIIDCGEQRRTVMVPVAEIRISMLDNKGSLVTEKENAVTIFIEYLDGEGNTLDVLRMAKE